MPKVVHYLTRDGRDPYQESVDAIHDMQARVLILRRIGKLELGIVGQCDFLREGVSELKIDHGPGYRVYFNRQGDSVALLLCAGDKRTQSRDIERAIAYLKDHKERTRGR